MRTTRAVLALFCVALFVSSGPAQSTSAADTPAAEVSGEVSLVQGKSGHIGDASQVVVWLAPLDALQRVRTASEKSPFQACPA